MTKETTAAQKFGARLEEARARSGMSNQAVADKINVSVRTWNNYKVGEREPGIATIIRLCDLLRTSPSYLFGFEEDSDKIGIIASTAVASLLRHDVQVTPESVRLVTDALVRLRKRNAGEPLDDAADTAIHALLDALQQDQLRA